MWKIWPCLFCIRHKKSRFGNTMETFEKSVLYGQSHSFHDWKSFRGVPSRTPFLRFIGSCQNPIGRGQPKNWNLWLCHIKQRSGKKVDRILCWWYRDWWQSIRGMTREVLKCLLLLYESKEWPKKAPADRRKWQKTPKSSRNGYSWVEMGRRPYQNDQKSKINKNPIELLRQNP